MTHPTDEELNALVQELMNRPYRRGSESNDEAAMRRQGEREQAAAAITAMRAQLAEAWAKLSQRVDMHECAMAERDDATLYGVEQKARADRAEAALAAQIEVDAGVVCRKCGASRAAWLKCSHIICLGGDAFGNQSHDRTALDRMLRAEREKALREAAEYVGKASNTFPDNIAWAVEDLANAILTMIEHQ